MASSQAAMEIAGRAANLSAKLYAIDDSVRRSANEIESIASEVGVLSAVLWRLHDAMAIDPNRYTKAFQEDLGEILQELDLLFDEIGDVGTELEKQDGIRAGFVGRFLKRGRVQHLLKHLATLKTTLAVMKTVLQHGCEFNPESAPRFPELPLKTDPHTLGEEHAILESVFLNHRNAIEELHALDDEYQRAKSSGDAHHRRGSSSLSDIPEFPPIPDTVSPSKPTKRPLHARNSFARRGMRLGVHMSILDMGAHKAPDTLKDKWIQTSRAQTHRRTMSGALSNPSSSNSTSSPSSIDKSPGSLKPNRRRAQSASVSAHNNNPEGNVAGDDVTARKEYRLSHGWLSHHAAEKLHHVIDRLEVSKDRDSRSNHEPGAGEAVSGRLVPSLHKRRKSTTTLDILNSFSE